MALIRRHRWPVLAGLLLLVVGLAAFASLRPLAAFEIEFSGRAVKRDILALYDSRAEGAPHLTRLHKLAEMPLNHLGYRLVYHDVNTALPEMSVTARHRAVLSWFVEPLDKPEPYIAWLERGGSRLIGARAIAYDPLSHPSRCASSPSPR